MDGQFLSFLICCNYSISAEFWHLYSDSRPMTVLQIRKWRTLLRRRQADAACALTGWHHFSRGMTLWPP